MKYYEELGIAAPEFGWVPSPTFILRRAAILDEVRKWAAGSVLEVGCGSGAISYELARRGFSCAAVETSPRALRVAEQILAESPRTSVLSSLPEDSASYDYLISFEVLEHIEDDASALESWVGRLRPGGQCLLSVPAHAKRWNVTDVAAGHFRRYDRTDVLSLVEGSGLHSIEISTYGWPASWIIERVRNLVRTVQLETEGVVPEEIEVGDAGRTSESGVERSVEARLFPIYGSLIGRKVMQLLTILQRPFKEKDWGISYLVSAKK